VEGGAVAMQQQGELGHPTVSDQQDLVDVVDVDDPEHEALPAMQPKIPEIDEHYFRLRGIRTRQLPGCLTKITQYRVVWGERPNRSDYWVNEDDVQILMLRPPCERSSRDMVIRKEQDTVRVHRMRCVPCSKGRKVFEYLVEELSTWITEDQLGISLSPTLLTQLRGKYLGHQECCFATASVDMNVDADLRPLPVLEQGGLAPSPVQSQRWKLSTPLGDRTASTPPKKRLRSCLSIISEGEEERPPSTSVRSTTASSTPGASESAHPIDLQLTVQAFDDNDNEDWEVRKIIGKENIDGVLYYLVDWSPTLVPERSLEHTRELVDKFEARLLGRRKIKNERGKLGSKRGWRVVGDAPGGQQQKRPRGRPPKQI
jgi:hypothetical protein